MSVSLEIEGGLVHLSGNEIKIKLTASEAKLNHVLLLKVTCPTLIGSPFIEEAACKDLGAAFNISGLVDQPVEFSFDFPSTGVINGHGLLRFLLTIDVGESWYDDQNNYHESWMDLQTGNEISVLSGMLRSYEKSLLNQENKSFASEYINGGKFLTNLPLLQRIRPDQIPLLWYLGRWTEDRPITAHLRYWSNVKTNGFELTRDGVIYTITGLVEFAVHPYFWGATFVPGEYLTRFEFWVTDADGVVSETRSYEVDNEFYEKSFIFYYVNSLSGIDNIWLHGEYSEGLTTEKEYAIKPVPSGSSTRVASRKTVLSSGRRWWELNTGYYDRREDLLALRDFLESGECWMIDPDRYNRLIPVNIVANDYKLFKSDIDYIPNLDVKIEEAH